MDTAHVELPAAALLELPEALRPAAADTLATFAEILQEEPDAQVRADVSEHFRELLQQPLRQAGYSERDARVTAFRMVELVVAHCDALVGRAIAGGAQAN